MPDRVVRARILDSENVAALSFGAEVFYRRLMSVVDDYGRFDGRVAVLRASLYPLTVDQVSVADVQGWLAECSQLITQYVVDGKPYVEILNFNQRTRAVKSRWPEPPDSLTSAVNCQQIPASAGSCGGAGAGAAAPIPTPHTTTTPKCDVDFDFGSEEGSGEKRNQQPAYGPMPKKSQVLEWARVAGRPEEGEKFWDAMVTRGWLTYGHSPVAIRGPDAVHAALKTWIRKADEFIQRDSRKSGGKSLADREAEELAEIRRRRRGRENSV